MEQFCLGRREMAEFEIEYQHFKRGDEQAGHDEQPAVGQKALFGQVVGYQVEKVEIHDEPVKADIDEFVAQRKQKALLRPLCQSEQKEQHQPEEGVVGHPPGQQLIHSVYQVVLGHSFHKKQQYCTGFVRYARVKIIIIRLPYISGRPLIADFLVSEF